MARHATARVTQSVSGWLRSALPGVVTDAPDVGRGRRDRVIDATIYLVAFVIGAFTLADTWQMHPPWLRVVAAVVGIATLVALRWRRTHPGAVGIGIGAVSLVILPASGANLAATFNAAIRARAIAACAGRSRRGGGPRGRAAADRPRDARRARPPSLAALRPRRRARVSPRRPGRGGRRGGRRDPREREDGARGAAQ